jgi:hypothetical protein
MLTTVTQAYGFSLGNSSRFLKKMRIYRINVLHLKISGVERGAILCVKC